MQLYILYIEYGFFPRAMLIDTPKPKPIKLCTVQSKLPILEPKKKKKER